MSTSGIIDFKLKQFYHRYRLVTHFGLYINWLFKSRVYKTILWGHAHHCGSQKTGSQVSLPPSKVSMCAVTTDEHNPRSLS